MRGLLSIAFLLSAGGAADAQSFSFNVGGQPVRVDVRGYCAECVSVAVPGYVQYGRPHYSDYEIPYMGRRPTRTPRAVQMPKRQPDAMAPRAAQAPGANWDAAATLPQPAAMPTSVAPWPEAAVAAPIIIPPVAASSSPEQPVAVPQAAQPAGPAATAATSPRHRSETPEPSPVASAPRPAPATPAESVKLAAEPAVPVQQAATTVPSAQPAKPAAEQKPEVIAALPPKHEAEMRPRPAGNSPFGVWSSSDGQMRVESCGKRICSYAVGGPHAGKMILRYMRPAGGNRWSGQVTDVRSGQIYSASMSMRGPNALNIQGCALGGLVCGGQTFTRAR